jgi:O-antigen ligase
MASIAARSPLPRWRLPLPVIAPAALLLALACGAVAVQRPKEGIGLVAAVAVGVIAAADTRYLPVLLTSTIFVESLSVGSGLRVGRVGAALAIAFVSVYLLARGRAGLRANALLTCVVVYGMWLLASGFWAAFQSDVAQSFAEYALAVAYMVAFAVLVRSKAELLQVAATLAIGSFLFGLLGVYQYVTHTGVEDRAVGLQGDPNYYAVYQAIALPLVLVLAARERPTWRAAYYVVPSVIVLSVVASLSRTGLLTLALVAVATFFLPWRFFFRDRGSKRVYVGVLCVAAAAAVSIGSTTIIARAQTIFHNSPTGDRGSGRTDLWKAARHAYSDHPWLGVGAGNFRPLALQYLQNTPGVDTRRNYVHAERPVHNAYLEQLTNLGPVGLALFLAVLGLTARMYLRSFRRARAAAEQTLERFSVALLVSFTGFCFAGIFLSSQTLKPLWIMIGLALALDVMTRDLRPAAATTRMLSRQRPVERVRFSRVGAGYAPPVVTGGPTEHVDQEHENTEIDPFERERFERERVAVRELREELRARAAKLDEQERALAERQRALEAGGKRGGYAAPAQPPPVDKARGEALTAREAELQALADELARKGEQLSARERALGKLETDLHRKASELARAPVAVQPPLTPPDFQPTATNAEPVRHAASATFPELEFLVHAYRDEFPDKREEWDMYLAYLSDYADAEGRLPVSFEGLISDVFLPLDSLPERERRLVRRAVSPAAEEPRAPEPASDGGRDWSYYETLLEDEPPSTNAPEEVPEPVVIAASTADIPTFSATEMTKGNATVTLPELERLVAANEAESPDRAKEWNYYLYYLREYADADGQIPAYFESLIDSVFSQLLAR